MPEIFFIIWCIARSITTFYGLFIPFFLLYGILKCFAFTMVAVRDSTDEMPFVFATVFKNKSFRAWFIFTSILILMLMSLAILW